MVHIEDLGGFTDIVLSFCFCIYIYPYMLYAAYLITVLKLMYIICVPECRGRKTIYRGKQKKE